MACFGVLPPLPDVFERISVVTTICVQNLPKRWCSSGEIDDGPGNERPLDIYSGVLQINMS
jgi:hypothetical protein